MFNKIIANDRGVVGVDAFLTGGGDPRGGGIGDGRHQAKRSKNNKNKSENKNENKNNNNNIADDRRVGGIDASFISGGGDPRGGAEVSATVDIMLKEATTTTTTITTTTTTGATR